MKTHKSALTPALSSRSSCTRSSASLLRERWVDWRTRNLTIVAPFLLGFEITAVLRKKVYRGLLHPRRR